MSKQGYTGNWRPNPITAILDQNELSKVKFENDIEKMFADAGLISLKTSRGIQEILEMKDGDKNEKCR
ncbi:hypothetical protein [Bacillus licheniformis]|uniref:hypothetical protein n=1 Tax=Bacillus licheniformis TaxID=1402 RepID=UPI00129E7CEB|nr:hypothetical protein [Bacillus licheniformis]QGI43717.1 hypothetical protein GII88_11400 [Bacillus licheniformis]